MAPCIHDILTYLLNPRIHISSFKVVKHTPVKNGPTNQSTIFVQGSFCVQS